MYGRVYKEQCEAEEGRHRPGRGRPDRRLTLFALALGTFAIGSGEFGSNGVIQLFSSEFDVSVPLATWAITAYAIGVMIGSPLITLVFARLNRRTLLLGLICLFVAGNELSAIAPNIWLLIAARFLTGTVQGAYFGAGAVVASYVYGPGKGGKAFATVMTGLTVATVVGSPVGTFIGQNAGWRVLYVIVAGAGVLAGVALLAWVPRTRDLDGASVGQELGALRKPMVWVTMAVAALGISSIFAVYTFIGPFVTDAALADPGMIPVALAIFGLGMATGNTLGGRAADAHPLRVLVGGYTGVLVVLVLVGLFGRDLGALFPSMFGVGLTMMFAIPAIQVLLNRFAPEAPTLVGALNLAALNLANALGALGGAVTLSAGLETLSPVCAGFVLTSAGLILFLATVPRALKARRRPHVGDSASMAN
jgi:MFS transporter, DHA1 family, inner membrane transport protein